jgi:LL-diaminopimelate aminotransferase
MSVAQREAKSSRLRDLPAYLFEELVRTRVRTEKQGVDVIDLSIGDPDLGTPEVVVEALKRNAGDRRLHCYTPPWVTEKFCEAASCWMSERYGVDLDPASELYPLVGTKEGLGHLPIAVMDPGDVALVPDPGYPVYSRGVWFAGGKVEWLPLVEEKGFQVDLDALTGLSSVEGRSPRLVFVNYPNNPTSAMAGVDFYGGLVRWASGCGTYVANDAAYAEVVFGGTRSASILQIPGAKDVAVEFHSFSKTFNMAGWRVGFVAGNAGVVGALRTLKSNLDSGVFGPILMASITAMEEGLSGCRASLKEYGSRRGLILECLRESGLDYFDSPATLYVWVRTPRGTGSMEFARTLLERAGVLVAPGVGFGEQGEGYVRMSITCPTSRIEIAAQRIAEVSNDWK